MKAQELIDRYNQQVEKQAQESAREREEKITAAKAKFLEFCRIWLGDFWDDLQPREVEIRDKNSQNISFSLPVSFMGYDGDLRAVHHLYQTSHNAWTDSKIDFGWINLEDGNTIGWLKLSIEKGETAQPIPLGDMGHLLSAIAKGAPRRAERVRKHLEEKRAEALVFDYTNLNWIVDQVNKRVVEFPDLEHQIRAAGAAAIEAIAAETRAREEEKVRYQAMQEEGNRIAELAAGAWNQVFTVYKIDFGAYIGDGEGGTDVYKETIYTLSEDPESDGYFKAFSSGYLSRRIRPAHILSTEIITVRNIKDAPYELRICMDITSKKYPDVSRYVALPPHQFWPESFDFDLQKELAENEVE